MMNFYKYLYYRLYSWNLKTWGESDFPQGNAHLGVSFMMGLNLWIIPWILDLVGFIDVDKISNKEAVALFLTLLFINYFWSLHKRKYKKIAAKYRHEPKGKRRRNAFLLWLYVIFSFGILLILAEISGRLKGLR
jgi:hypothetical protein